MPHTRPPHPFRLLLALLVVALPLAACGERLGTGPVDVDSDRLGQVLRAVRDSGGAPTGPHATPPPWEEIVGPPQGEVTPLDGAPEVVWRDDLAAAFEEAAREDRPLFVTFRCPLCKQCSEFDNDVMLGSPELDPVLAQFVTVRILDAYQIDMRLFPVQEYQDFDLSWWGWTMSPEGRLYGVYGGRDHVSDQTRISVPGLVNVLERTLAHHYDPRRPEWGIDGPLPDADAEPLTPMQLPGWDSWAARGALEQNGADCLHCHQVGETLRQPALDAGTFDKDRDLRIWPLPENVGMTLDRDHGLLVTSVESGSPAALAGVRPGDVLAHAGGNKLFSQTDFRAALHNGPAQDGEIPFGWLRDGELLQGELEVSGDWRSTILDWRVTVSGGNIGADPGFFPLPTGPEVRRRLDIPDGTMAVRPYLYGDAARAAGLRDDDIVVAVGGESPDLTERGLTTWFRLRYDPGMTVTVTAVDPQGNRREVSWELQPRGS